MASANSRMAVGGSWPPANDFPRRTKNSPSPIIFALPQIEAFTLHAGEADWPEFDKKTSALLVAVDPEKKWAEINVPKAVIWALVRQELLLRPQYVAQAVGIEQLAYLTDLKNPEKVPSPSELAALWKNYAKCTKKQVTKIARAWDDFCAKTSIQSIRDITAEMVVTYRDDLQSRSTHPRGVRLQAIHP